jgi:hypothetical protein
MRFSTRISSFLGFVAGAMLSLFGKSPAGPGADDLKRADFPASTQRLGIRFTERIRDAFRFKWIRPTRRTRTPDDTRTEESERSNPPE